MSLAWYLKRLRAMSLPEVFHRLEEQVKRRTARSRLEGWERFEPVAIESPFRLFAASLPQAEQGLICKINYAAEFALEGRYHALGRDWPKRNADNLYPETLWVLDPVSDRSWPCADLYCFDISYRHERDLGDIKYVWEINRLQFLQPLAARAFLAQDKAAIDAIERALESWFRANPPFRGLGWNSGIEVALRAISLLIVSGLVANQLSDKARARIAQILSASLFWLDRFPSRFSSANNHRIAEDAARYLICLALPSTRKTSLTLEEAAGDLEREVALQILSDGAPAEQSPTYGAFTAEFVLMCLLAGQEGPRPLSQAVLERLNRFASFVEALSDRTGHCPRIGDDDEGRVMTLSQPEPDYATNIAGLIRTVAKLETPFTGQNDLRDAWAVPSASTPTEPVPARDTFLEGGYSVLRRKIGEREVELVMDHGPLGYLSIAAHGHADALSIMLSVDGEPLFIDPGTYLYHSGGAWRDWFRSTRAHNTLTLNGQDQSTISGTFNWSSKANAQRLELKEGDAMSVYSCHDGYSGTLGLEHHRHVSLIETGLEITDFLRPVSGKPNAKTPPDCELVFQLAEGLNATQKAATVVEIKKSSYFTSNLILPPHGKIEISTGEEGFDGGWVSPAFGRLVPATRIAWRGRLNVGSDGGLTRLEIG
ncbi:MAG: heparinase II/III-family protein [Dinoroseobacter sp.]|nr:heparinase II/III-family protein [Dinoroseobacter sp.]